MDEHNKRQIKQEMTNKYLNENDEEHLRTSIQRSRCYMSGCKNNRICKEKGTSIPMFLFPSDLNLAKFWLGICNHQPYECPYHGQTVCKDHFRMENLSAGNFSDSEGIVLKPNVIPTAQIPNICYSMILEYLRQKKNCGKLDPKEIGVDFSCAKQDCTFARPMLRKSVVTPIRLCYGNAKKPTTSKDSNSGGLRITLK